MQHYKNQEDGIIAEVNNTLDEITDIEMQRKAAEQSTVEVDMEGQEE